MQTFVSSFPYWLLRFHPHEQGQENVAAVLFVSCMIQDGVYGMFLYSHAMLFNLLSGTVPITYEDNYAHFHAQHGEIMNGLMHLIGICMYHAMTYAMLTKLCMAVSHSLRYVPLLLPLLAALFWQHFDVHAPSLALSILADIAAYAFGVSVSRMPGKDILFVMIVSAYLFHGVLGHGMAFNLGNLEIYDGNAERRTHEAFLLPSTFNVLIDVLFFEGCVPTPIFEC